MDKDVKEIFEKWKNLRFIYWIALLSGLIEEILKKRRRTTLAIGAAISLYIYYIK